MRLLASPEDLRAAEREAAAAQGVVVMDANDWQVAQLKVAAMLNCIALGALVRDATGGR